MRPVILYRGRDFEESEIGPAIDAGFEVYSQRTQVKKGDLVIGRYSVLPFYKETEKDINSLEARLINTYNQHLYIADLKNWYQDLEWCTPKTYFNYQEVPYYTTHGYVVKGCTNSKKFEWNKSMFVGPTENRDAHDKVIAMAEDLKHDGLLCSQDMYIREFVPLKTYMKGLYDLPITNEFRFFTIDGKIISSGFYWSNYVADIEEKIGRVPLSSDVPKEFLRGVLSCIKERARAIVVDVAEAASGEWVVIELNDLQMSGLSCNDPYILYENLFDSLRRSES